MDESLSRIESSYPSKKHRLLNSFPSIHFHECEFFWFHPKVCAAGRETNTVGTMHRGRYDATFIFGASGSKLKFWK